MNRREWLHALLAVGGAALFVAGALILATVYLTWEWL